MKDNSKKVTLFMIVVAVILSLVYISTGRNITGDNASKYVTGIILNKKDGTVNIEDENNNVYEFDEDEIKEEVGTEVKVEYKEEEKKPTKPSNSSSTSSNNNSGSSKPNSKPNSNVPPKEEEKPNNTVVDYEVITKSEIPSSWLDGGIFKDYYVKAFEKLQTLTLEEKIGQMLLARYPNSNQVGAMNQYHLGGYVFYAKDFSGKSRNAVIQMINSVKTTSKVPLLTAIDEEGGTVTRLSGNPNLVSTPFKSPQDLYRAGGLAAIRDDVKNKSSVLKGLGLNLNLAPVVDVSTNPSDYIYKRTLGLGTEETSMYASTVIGASKGTGVSYTLKHFPGYGSNLDTHVGSSVDKKSLDKIRQEDLPPFKAGIAAGAEAVLVSHNIVESIDSTAEASISKKVHDLLREELEFKGVIITDDISMGAMAKVANIATKAVLAGNDILITTNYQESFNQIKTSVDNKTIKTEDIDRTVFRILAWKYYKGLL